MRAKKGPPDFILFISTIALLGIGLIMVFSSSAVTSSIRYDDTYYFFRRQSYWAVLGIMAMLVMMKINYNKLKALALPFLIISLLCLVLVITPLGIEVNESNRWLGVGFIHFAPSDLAKLGVVMFLARSMEQNLSSIRLFSKGVLPYLLLIALVSGLILLQPDLGTAFTIAATVFFMLLAAGARWSHLGALFMSGIAAIVAAIAVAPYRLERIFAFANPWKYASDEGYQTIQSLYALGSGGLFGLGLGRSRQKFFYLPEQHTDFIFAILGEELGFIGAALVLLLFLLLAWRGFRTAIKAPDTFGSLLAVGITLMIVFQALVNIAVVAGALPVTGITLPFISYGGSSLLFTLCGVGLLLNISRYCN